MKPRRIGAVTIKALAAAAIAIAAALPAQPAFAAATNFYVDPVNGNDGNSGTSTASAFRTIQAAQNAVRAINSNMADDIVVNLRGGTYTLTAPISFGTGDSGTNGHTVVYQSYNGETPVISGGQSITGWTAASNGEFKASIGSLNFRQLYVNGVRATRARFPDAGTDFQLQGSDSTNKLLKVLASQTSNWGNLNQVEMMLETQWGESYLRLKSISTAGSTANISIQDHEAGILFQRPFPILANGSPCTSRTPTSSSTSRASSTSIRPRRPSTTSLAPARTCPPPASRRRPSRHCSTSRAPASTAPPTT